MTREELLGLLQSVDELVMEDKQDEVQATCREVAERTGSNELFNIFFDETESQTLTELDRESLLLIASIAAGYECKFKSEIFEEALLKEVTSSWPDCFHVIFLEPYGYMPPKVAIKVVEEHRGRVINLLARMMSHGAMEGENQTVRLHQLVVEIAASNAFIENVNQISTVLQDLGALDDFQTELVRTMLLQRHENGAFGAAEMTRLKETEKTRQQLFRKLPQLAAQVFKSVPGDLFSSLEEHQAARAIIERNRKEN